MAMFAILLGFTRIGYAKYGKNIIKTLTIGMSGAVFCYLVAGLSTNIYFAFGACILTGLFTAMLWPGTLIMMEENLPGIGVAAYALMAAGGDFGASLAPQLLGVVVDKVAASNIGAELSASLNLSTEQIGLKAGMLATSIYPILGVALLIFAARYFKKLKSVQE